MQCKNCKQKDQVLNVCRRSLTNCMIERSPGKGKCGPEALFYKERRILLKFRR